MKLKLSYDRGAAVLEVLEEVAPRSVEALKAGVANILREGRRAIVIDLSGARGADAAFAVELIKLDAVASAKGGRLAFVGRGELIREALKATGLATVRLYSSPAAAVSVLTSPDAVAPDSADPAGEREKLKTSIAGLAAENERLKAEVASLGGGAAELRALRKANGRLAAEIATTNARLAELAKERRPTASSQLLDRKIEAFERLLAHLLGAKT